MTDDRTKFDITADDLAKSLANRGILLDHDFEGFEDGTVSDDVQVVSGHGQAVKSEIEAIVRKLDLSKDEERGMNITVIEEDDRDIVLWFHISDGT